MWSHTRCMRNETKFKSLCSDSPTFSTICEKIIQTTFVNQIKWFTEKLLLKRTICTIMQASLYHSKDSLKVSVPISQYFKHLLLWSAQKRMPYGFEMAWAWLNVFCFYYWGNYPFIHSEKGGKMSLTIKLLNIPYFWASIWIWNNMKMNKYHVYVGWNNPLSTVRKMKIKKSGEKHGKIAS